MNQQVRMEHTAVIHREPDVVYAFAATPKTWPRWHPTATSVSGEVDRQVRVGDEVFETDRFAFLRGSIVWSVTAADPGHGWSYDGVLSGVPLAAGTITTVTYRLNPIDEGTWFQREMTYSIPNPIFRMLDRAYFERHNAHQSARAVQTLKSLVESDARP